MKKPKSSWQLKELTNFVNELTHLLAAGLPLLTALCLLKEHLQTEQEMLLAKQLQQKIEKGISLAKAWRDLTQEALSSALLVAGEESGLLVEMLKHIANYAKIQRELQQIFWQAIRYPLFLLTMTCALLGLLCNWVVPQFSSLYSSFNVQLPYLTKFIVSSSAIFHQYLLNILLGVMLFIFLWIASKKQPRVKKLLIKLKRKFLFYREMQELRLWHATALLLQAGIPLSQALTICQNILEDDQTQAHITYLIQQLQHGLKPSAILKQQRCFSKKLIAILALAEVSGQLSTLLTAHVLQQTQQLQLNIQTFKTWLEPIFLCIIGGLIGIVLIALYLPIVELGKWV